MLLLSKPFTTPLFLQAMHMAAAGNHRLQRLRQENARLQDKIGQPLAGQPGKVLSGRARPHDRGQKRTAT
ncbi:MAG: hypothetical protein ACLVJH_09240 [Faecalibacterium prausnitzii]